MAKAFGEVRLTDKLQSGTQVALLGRTLFNKQDYQADLQGFAGAAKYERMRRDPEIAGALLRWKAPLFAASWKFEAPKSAPKKLGEEMVALCDRYILGVGRERVSDTFKAGLLPQMLLAFDFGVSAVEKVWGVNERGQQVYARLSPIPPQTIYDFELGDLGEVARLHQYAYVKTPDGSTFRKQAIPDPDVGGTAREKLAVFTYRQEGDDYFGRPILRECYRPWFHKCELWALDGVQKERAGLGLTIIKIPKAVLDPTDEKYLAAVQIVQNVRANESMGAVIGEDWELEQKWPTGQPPDIQASMRYCDEQIVRAFVTEEAHLASQGSGGSRALGETKQNTSGLHRQALADMVESWVNTQLVPILIERNFGPQEEYPSLQCEDMDAMSGTDAANIAKMLSDAKILRYDRKLEEYYRETNDLPEIDEATREEPPDPMELAAAQAAANPKADPSEKSGQPPADGATPPKEPPAAKADAPAVAADPYRFSRAPLPHEQHVRFEKMADFLDSEPNRIWHRVVKPFRDQQIESIAKEAAKATVAQLSRGIYGPDDKKPRVARMTDELTAALLEVYRKGRRSTLEDRARQMRLDAGKADEDDEEIEDDEALITPAQRSWIRDIASGFVVASTFKLITEAVRAGLNAHQRNLPPAQVESVVRLALMPTPVGRVSEEVAQADLAGTVTRAYTTGRVEQAQAVEDELTSVFYSAIMDQNTCGPCAAMDGEELDKATYDTQVPNGNCEGGDRCRCQPVFVFRPAERSEAA